MQFENHLITEPFSDHIQAIFHYKGYSPEHRIERVVPTGHLFIIFELDGITRNTFDNQTLEPNGSYRHVWISGMHKEHISISTHEDSEMLVIQFKTSGTYPFFKSSIDQLTNKITPAQEVFGDQILQLRSDILNASDTLGKFELVDSWLQQQYDPKKSPPEELKKVLTQLELKPISDGHSIIESYPNSQKHLINQFKMYFGLTPKTFHRIFRFNSILRQIQNKDMLSWSQIAYEFGYADQSHFIKEFKAFSGFNPQQYLKKDYHKGETNFFPIDDQG